MTSVGTTNLINRDQWLEVVLKAQPSGLELLDVGAGQQRNRKFCGHLNYTSQDFAQYDGKGDGRGLQTEQWDNSKLDIVSDITQIPRLDESFDIILCTEVLEHIPQPLLAIKEFQRLLKPKGILIITAPFCSLTHFAPYHYYSGYNKYFYEHHLSQNGFQIMELNANGNYFEYLAQEIRRIPSIVRDYTPVKTNKIFGLISRIMLKFLSKFSTLDRGSNELLCFGYHVRAVKQ